MAILQDRLPFAPWTDPVSRRLPGTRPAAPDDWVRIDEAYAGQMALRERLLDERPDDVLGVLPEAEDASGELLDAGLDRLGRAPGFRVGSAKIDCPDGREVAVDRADPLGTLGRLVQEDLCLLQKPAGGPEHLLTAAVLCFPASWTLSEKIGRPISRVHAPVAEYAPVESRAQRLFDGLQPDRPIWRANAHLYDAPDLFTPRREAAPRRDASAGRYVRSEFQVLFRLPRTRAIVFSIHTYMLRRSALSPDQEARLSEFPLAAGD